MTQNPFDTMELEKEICPVCNKSVLKNTKMKMTKSNLKDGIHQIGQGMKKPLITLCSFECYEKFIERQHLKAIVEKDWIEKKEVEGIIDKCPRILGKAIDVKELKQKLGLSQEKKK